MGIFCLLTKLFTYNGRTTFVFTSQNFSFFKFFRGAPDPQNTLNSSLRSKNFWISNSFCMRHIYGLVRPHTKFGPVWAKNGRGNAVFSSKVPFLGHFETFEAPWGGLGWSNWSKNASGHCMMYKKGARKLSSGSADPTDFDLIQALKIISGAYTRHK